MTQAIDIDALNRRFGVTNHVRFATGPGGLTLAELTNSHASASLVLEGGQVLTYVPREHAPVLWVSPHARYEAGKSVRGGIPVCWPWFGPHASDSTKPAHGFARNAAWRVIETLALNDGATRIVLELSATDAQRALWPHDARLQLHVSVGPHLVVELVTFNGSTAAFRVTEALHTYLQVGDIERISIDGLNGCRYVDKVGGGGTAVQNGPIRIAGETDRVYLGTRAACVVHDTGLKRRIHVEKTDSASTVVWNPWIDKALKLGDMGSDGYRHMLCIEAANALDDAVSVAPDSEHRLTTVIHVERA
jgi:D-hexose-6-phosphate mutarotase